MLTMPATDPGTLLERLRADPEPALLLAIVSAGPPAYIVGGSVRDMLLERTRMDLDVVIDGPLAAVVAALCDAGATVIADHGQFETATVQLGGTRCDLARSRTESYPHPGALPRVRPGPIDSDLRRRDFTVNAIALQVSGPRAGELHAVEHALDDLHARRLRVLHPDSFRDDPTRLLRLARYASRLGLSIEPATYARASAAVGLGALRTISGARVGAELALLATEPDPVAALRALAPLGLDAAIALGFGVDGAEPATAALALLGDHGDRAALALGAALERVDAGERRPLLHRLEFDRRRRDLIAAVADWARPGARALALARAPSQIAAAVGDAPVEAVALAGAIGGGASAAGGGDAAASAARAWIEQLRFVRPAIDGGDLVCAGVKPGPAIGLGLQAALNAKLDGHADGREQELAVALQAIAATGPG